jgi:hypothetical protein
MQLQGLRFPSPNFKFQISLSLCCCQIYGNNLSAFVRNKYIGIKKSLPRVGVAIISLQASFFELPISSITMFECPSVIGSILHNSFSQYTATIPNFNFQACSIPIPKMVALNYPPNPTRPPKLTFSVEIELDFAIPRADYAQWLATDPLNQTARERVALDQKADELLAKITALEAENGVSISPTKLAEARAAIIQEGFDLKELIAEYEERFGRDASSSSEAKEEGSSQSSNADQSSSSSNGTHASPSIQSQPIRHPEPSLTSTDSQDEDLRDCLIQYLFAYLNRLVPSSPSLPALYGLLSYAEPKTAPPSSWHLTYDTSLFPSRVEFAKIFGSSLPTVLKTYRCVGAELVSSILEFHDEEKWVPMFKQLEDDLRWDGEKGHGVWFAKQENLHVHFSFSDGSWDLDVAKTIMVLYGLFQHEIERWVRADMRTSIYCKSLRFGMETDRVARGEDGWPVLVRGKKYTPREFSERIWKARSFE